MLPHFLAHTQNCLSDNVFQSYTKSASKPNLPLLTAKSSSKGSCDMFILASTKILSAISIANISLKNDGPYIFKSGINQKVIHKLE